MHTPDPRNRPSCDFRIKPLRLEVLTLSLPPWSAWRQDGFVRKTRRENSPHTQAKHDKSTAKSSDGFHSARMPAVIVSVDPWDRRRHQTTPASSQKHSTPHPHLPETILTQGSAPGTKDSPLGLCPHHHSILIHRRTHRTPLLCPEHLSN